MYSDAPIAVCFALAIVVLLTCCANPIPMYGGGKIVRSCHHDGVAYGCRLDDIVALDDLTIYQGGGDSDATRVNGVCFRTLRKRTHVIARIVVGVPARQYDVLVRFDSPISAALLPEHRHRSIRLFDEHVFESSTLGCDVENASCYDTFVVSDAAGSEFTQRRVLIGFSYENWVLAHQS